MNKNFGARARTLCFLIPLVFCGGAHAALTCTPRPPLEIAISGNGTYIHNSCNETGVGTVCMAERNQVNDGDYKNSKKLFTGYELNKSQKQYDEGKAIVQTIGEYFDKGYNGSGPYAGDKILDQHDCPPFRVAIVGHSHGAWAAAKVVAYLKQFSKAGDVKIADFDKSFSLRVGLIDAVSFGFPRGFGQLNSNPFQMPKANACIYNVYQRGTNQGGCPDTYCKPLGGALNAFIYKGERFLDGQGTMPMIDFEKDFTGEMVNTNIDTGDGSTSSQEAHHLNMEQSAKVLAQYVFNGGSGAPVAPAALYADCGNPTFLNANPASVEAPSTPTSDAKKVISELKSGKELLQLQSALGESRVTAAMDYIVHFHSLAQAAGAAMAEPGSSASITQALRSRVSEFAAAAAAIPEVEPQLKTEIVVQDGLVSLLYVPRFAGLRYLTPVRNDVTVAPVIPFQLSQMMNGKMELAYEFLQYAGKRFYAAGLNDVHDDNIVMLMNDGVTVPGSQSTKPWDPELKVLIPSSFAQTDIPGTSETVYPWNFISQADPDNNVYLQASGLALDFTRGQARVILEGSNVTFLRKLDNTWKPYAEVDATTGYPTTIIHSNEELISLFANLGFRVNNDVTGLAPQFTVALEFINNGGTSKQVRQTVYLGMAGTKIGVDFVAPYTPNFDAIVPEELGLNR